MSLCHFVILYIYIYNIYIIYIIYIYIYCNNIYIYYIYITYIHIRIYIYIYIHTCIHIANQYNINIASQLTGFYMRATLAFNGLSSETVLVHFLDYIHSSSHLGI